MKKNIKSNKSPAPATKSYPIKLAGKTVKTVKAVSAAAKPAKKIAIKPVAKPTKAAAPKAPAKSAAKAKITAIAAAPVVTTITALIDIGFGNALYLRGEGAGLSWDRGVLMNCVANDTWSMELGEASRPIIYKFLVNDLTWSAGEDYLVNSGSNLNIVPTF